MKPASKLKHCLVYSAVLSLAGLLAGCATQSKVPVYSNSEFNPAEVDRITLLPIVDLCQGQKVSFDVNSSVLNHAKSILEDKHYSVILDTNADAVAKLTIADLDADQAEWVRTVPCSSSRWIMIFAVHVVPNSGNAKLSGYLFDRQNGTKLWQDSGGASNVILLDSAIDVVTFPVLSRRGLTKAISNCMLGFPPSPKSK